MPPLLRALRPKQWAKNALVIAAPFAAGQLFTGSVLVATLSAFVCFCMAASAVYLVNDVRDAPKDRLHPDKQRRPIASGAVSPTLAVTVAVVLAAGALALAWFTRPALLGVLVVYLGLQVLYVVGLKDITVLDIAVVASGFLLRALAGGAATGIAISEWFLLVAGFGSLFVVAGKRYGELVTMRSLEGAEVGTTRSALTAYTPEYLRFVWTVAAAVTVIVYGLWVITVPRQSTTATLLSLVPFALALLEYARTIDTGGGGEPEEAILRNPVLLLLGLAWVATLGATLYR